MKTDFKLSYMPALDGLRGIAVLAVLLFHSRWNTSGYLGVDIFFLLSGFLITSLLLCEWHSVGQIYFKRFYLRRAFRLLPALFALLTACYLYETFYRPFPGPSIELRIAYALSYVGNWIWAFAAPDNPLTSLNAVWSLAIEEQFYFVWPATLYCLLRCGVCWRRIVAILGVATLVGMSWRHWLWLNGADTYRIVMGTDSHADPILIGCLLGLAISSVQPSYWRKFNTVARRCGPAMLIGLVVVVSCFDVPEAISLHAHTLAAILTAGIILTATVFPPSAVTRILEQPALVWVGKLSYGIYLWHGTVNVYLFYQFPAVPTIARIGIGFVLATISYYCLERPCMGIRKRLSNRVATRRFATSVA